MTWKLVLESGLPQGCAALCAGGGQVPLPGEGDCLWICPSPAGVDLPGGRAWRRWGLLWEGPWQTCGILDGNTLRFSFWSWTGRGGGQGARTHGNGKGKCGPAGSFVPPLPLHSCPWAVAPRCAGVLLSGSGAWQVWELGQGLVAARGGPCAGNRLLEVSQGGGRVAAGSGWAVL